MFIKTLLKNGVNNSMDFVKVAVKSLLLPFIFCIPRPTFAVQWHCDDALRSSHWMLPAKSQRLVIGMLAETTDGKRLLSVDDYYWGGHDNIHLHLLKDFQVKKILWSGEILLENPEKHTAQGIVVLSINTSGYAFEKIRQPDSQDENNPRQLKETLEKHAPDLTSQYSQYWAYSDEHAHLDPLFQNLHTRVRSSQGDTVRHRFRNILTVLVSLSNYFARSQPTSWQGEIKKLIQSSPDSMNDIMQFFDSQSRFTGQNTQLRSDQTTSLEKIRNGQNDATEQDFFMFADLIKAQSNRTSAATRGPETLIFEE